MPITSLYANTCAEIQDAAGRGSGHPSRIIPSHIITVLKVKGYTEPVIFYSLSENGGKYHYMQILTVFFQREKEFLPVDANQYLEALALQDRRPSVCLPSLRPECQMCLGWKAACLVCQGLCEKSWKIHQHIMPELKLLGVLQGSPAEVSVPTAA